MLSVTRTPQGGGITDIHITTILKMNRDRLKDRVVITTRDDVFYLPGPLKYWLNVINSRGYKFLYVDRSTAINPANVVSVNEIYKEAFFDHEVTRKSIKCEIAHHRYHEFVSELTATNRKVILT
ncbi:hypothetical protein ACINKY_21205 [Paenibacillus illinoisensis]|uniref:HTH LytTR-type domain-containing protein n=1 Tax=Paenibacillus illinoisensis TaxID=59845 RepID=A0ABW8HZ32_9BACL